MATTNSLKPLKSLAIWTLVLTILMFLVGSVLFRIEGFEQVISHPQFEITKKASAFIELIKGSDSRISPIKNIVWFRTFFIIDFIWSISLLAIINLWIRRVISTHEHTKHSKRIPQLIFICSCIAYSLDVYENLSYLRLLKLLRGIEAASNELSVIIDIKTLFYAFVILLTFFFAYQIFLYDRRKRLYRALKASSISLATIIVLFILATLVDQGSTVIVHLLQNPVSLLATFILINLLALCSAHYPDYVDKYFHGFPSSLQWIMKPLFGSKSFLGIGLVLYSNSATSQANVDLKLNPSRQMTNQDNMFLEDFRKLAGMTVLLTWCYALLFVLHKYEKLPFSPSLLIFILTLLFIVLYFTVLKSKQDWRSFFEKNKSDIYQSTHGTSPLEIPKNVSLMLRTMMLTLLLTIISLTITILLAIQSSWIEVSGMALVTVFFNTIYFIHFQHFRTVVSVVKHYKEYKWLSLFGLDDDENYVRFFAIAGLCTLTFFILITLEPPLINALVIILAFLYLIYGLVVVLLKHHMYYKQHNNNTALNTNHSPMAIFFEKYVPISGVLLITWIVFAGQAGNGLHILKPKKNGENDINYTKYREDLRNKINRPTYNGSYLISSYGGGLRATAWTMLVMDALEKTNPEIIENSLAMSGVSGGFLGLSFYSAIRHEHKEAAMRQLKIDTIARHSMLSIDVSYLLGYDIVREGIPYVRGFWGKDRAGRSMREYASLIQPDQRLCQSLMNSTYGTYWSQIYRASSYYPVLLGNTTGTHGKYGVAYPLTGDKSVFDSIFTGSENILPIDAGSSITYLDATSTTERFPIFSPTAQIEGKGHFLDGGYFENSGLLSIMNFYDYLLREHLPLNDSLVKVILIINDKDSYIRQLVTDSIEKKAELGTGELSAILSTVANISILPLAMEDRVAQRFKGNFIRIYLPYLFTYEDVIRVIGGVPEDPIAIQKIINKSNTRIKKMYEGLGPEKEYPVPPALARVLSDPAYDYMKKMLEHPDVTSALERIKN